MINSIMGIRWYFGVRLNRIFMFGVGIKNKIIFIFVIFCVFAINTPNGLFATGDDPDDVTSKEYFDDISKKTNEATEIAKGIDLDEYKDVIEEAVDRDIHRLNKIHEFNNTILFKIPLTKFKTAFKGIEKDIPLNITIRVGDLIQFFLFGADLFVDQWLFDTLSDYYTDALFEKIDKDCKNLITILENLNSVASQYTQDKKPDEEEEEIENSQEEFEKISLRFKDLEEELFSYFKKEYFLNYTKIIKDFFIKRTILYIVYYEITLWLKDWLIGPRNITSFEQLKTKKINESWLTEFITNSEASINLFTIFKFIFNSYMTNPLTTGTNFVVHLLSQKITEPFKTYVDKDGKDKKKFPFNFLDSYPCALTKEALILAKTIKTLDSEFYQKRWFGWVKNNFDELLDLLKIYETAPSKSKPEIRGKIKEFISRGLETNFAAWLKFKNRAVLSSETKVNMLFAIPTTFVIGKWAYEKYKDGTVDEVWENVKSGFSSLGKNKIIIIPIVVTSLILGTISFASIRSAGQPNY